ncbi:hypothetical protein [Coleofasciculus sp. FACHB-129]|nr:hypothetical protein [Coleofasciculus sp. FACHB-129]MBD1897320.1 hypothetical protein [Coleofasciculus sp. FACHB-129]
MLHNQEWLVRVASLLYEVGWVVSEAPALINRGYTNETRRRGLRGRSL